MNIKALAASAITAVAITCSGALAATVETINFGASPTVQASSFSFDALGTTDLLTVSPFPAAFGLNQVHRDTNGLGFNAFLIPDPNEVNITETLFFSFSRDVKLHSMTLSLFNPATESYSIVVDVTGEPVDITLAGTANPVDFGMVTSDFFAVSTLGLTSTFRIASLSISEVPVPAAGLLLVGALGGLGALKRRRQTA